VHSQSEISIILPFISSTVTLEGCNITAALTSPVFAKYATTLAEKINFYQIEKLKKNSD